jgi:hypothetical protein
MSTEKKAKPILAFVLQITILHFVTYFLFGAVAAVVLNYPYWYSVPPLSFYMKPTDSVWVAAGPLFQFIRGPIMGLALYPFRRIFVEAKNGWLYLWGIFLGIGILSTFGPAPGSIEGLVFTTFPAVLQIAFLPEVILQSLALSVLLFLWQRHPGDKRLWIPIVIVFGVLLALGTLGVLFTLMMP